MGDRNELRAADSVDGITRVVEDYLKAIWSATEWGSPPATVSSLAKRFGSTRPTVSATLRRLAERGLVDHERYGGTSLTEDGTHLAVSMVRRHRLLETYLVERLGYAWDDVHDEAENLEHAVSDTFVDRVDALLGHPGTDPHGDPIPGADGSLHYPPDAAPLARVVPGRYQVVRVSDDDPALLRQVARLGIVPGAVVEVGPVGRTGRREVGTGGARHTLAESAQQALIVRPV